MERAAEQNIRSAFFGSKAVTCADENIATVRTAQDRFGAGGWPFIETAFCDLYNK